MRVEIFKGENDRWYWRLVAGNGEIVAMCAGGKERGYVNADAAKRAWENIETAILEYAGVEVEKD